MKLILAFVLTFAIVVAEPTNLYDVLQSNLPEPLGTVPEDAYGNFTEYVERHGFTAEQHEVVTEDGYILVLFRISGIQGG